MATSTDEHRREARLPCDKSGSFLKMVGEESFEEGGATVLNFSSEGMLLRLPKAYQPGSILEVRSSDARMGNLTTILEARWSQPDPQSGRNLIGCRTLYASIS
jgi:hypothetical protein